MRRVRAEGSGIVLFHDIQDKTAAGLPEFLRKIKSEGYKIVHIVPGSSDFNYRNDVASRKTTESASSITTAKLPSSSSVQKVPAKEKAKVVRKRTIKVPQPKRKPKLRKLTSAQQAPVDKSQTTQSLQRGNGNISISPPIKQKKKFGLFRKIFGKRN